MKRNRNKNSRPCIAGLWLLGLSLTCLTGCRGLNHWYHEFQGCVSNHMVEYSNRALAEKAWIREKHRFCDRQYVQEFKDGFIHGYLDVATGGDGCTPTIAPPKYWGWAYQTPYGQAAVNAFFQGFPFGAKAAEQDGVGYWSEIPTSGLSNTLSPYGSGVITEEVVPMPVPEVIAPEAVEIVAPALSDGASLTIESPSDELVSSPAPAAAPSKQTAGNEPSTRQLVPASSGLQLPNSEDRTTTPTVSAQPVTQGTGSLPIEPATDSGELSFTFE